MTPDAASYDEGQRELEAATMGIAARLRARTVVMDDRESPEELVRLLEAVERFERAVQAKGGDLMVDEAPNGETVEPDDPHFVLPRREASEGPDDYIERIHAATAVVRRHRPH